MEKDTLYKLREIKYRRLVKQITYDVTNFVYKFTDESIEEFINRKYPGVKATMKYDKGNVWNINLTIPKPIQLIEVKFTVTGKGLEF